MYVPLKPRYTGTQMGLQHKKKLWKITAAPPSGTETHHRVAFTQSDCGAIWLYPQRSCRTSRKCAQVRGDKTEQI